MTDRDRLATLLGEHLHRKGVGCYAHSIGGQDAALKLHRDDAYDIVDFLDGLSPDASPTDSSAALREATIAMLNSWERGDLDHDYDLFASTMDGLRAALEREA